MKVCLIKPKSLSDHIQPPMGLAYLAASIRESHEVTLLDMLKQSMNDQIFRDFVKERAFDIIGLQCYTQDLPAVKHLLGLIKQHSPATLTIAGGPHPTLMPEETMTYLGDELDFILIGEGEENFPLFLEQVMCDRKDYSKVPCLMWRKDNTLVRNEGTRIAQDLNQLPEPAWDMIKPQTYPPAQHGAFFDRFPIAPIITTRGCPFRCTFCSATQLSGRRVRTRSSESILAEMKTLYDVYGIREFHIIDDNFSANKRHATSVLQAICDSDMDISLAFPNGIKVETIDDELLLLMKKANVYLISLGIESGSDRILSLMKKRMTVDVIREKCAMIQKAGIDMAGFFVLGFPTETLEEIRRTISFSLELPLIRANYFDFLPLPGTDIYKELLETGELANVDWDHFLFMSAPYVPKGITRNQLRNLQRLAFVRFYLTRPRILWKNISQIKSLKHFFYLSRRFYHWLLM